MARCGECDKYRHHQCTGRVQKGRAVGKQCDCVCTFADGPQLPWIQMAGVKLDPAVLDLYAELAANEVVVFYTARLELKFSPRQLPTPLLREMKRCQGHLMFDLAPWGNRIPVVRPGWLVGAVHPCYGCGTSCATADPLGNHRHVWCGWLEQVAPAVGLAGARKRARATSTHQRRLRAAQSTTGTPTTKGNHAHLQHPHR